MGDIFSAKILNQVWGLALVTLLTMQIACKSVDPEDPKCYNPDVAWAKGERYTLEGDRVNFVEIPYHNETVEEGKEIKWVYLRLDDNSGFIGAVKFRELMASEIPAGAQPGDFVKLLIRIDVPGWYYVPGITNVKVGGFNDMPSEDISLEQLDIHEGTATQKTGNTWEYYEVVLPRYLYYSVYVEAQQVTQCTN